MTHPLVLQLKFTRNEFKRGLKGVKADDAQKHFGKMNCISWIVGHLAWQEQRYWLTRAQGQTILPELNKLTANGAPQSTPPLDDMWAAWKTVTEAADPYLESLTTDVLTTHMIVSGKPHYESVGSQLRRVAYHYWYHNGEAQAIRQLLGHTRLGQFVGAIHDEAPYIPE
ncbi:MAG: DinB family protein [Anaerolineae bacterium]|nr:DinB family protein [Anaerolineae bacterium]